MFAVSLVWFGGDPAGLSLAAEGVAAFVDIGLLDNCAEIFSLPAKKIMLDSKRDISYLRGRGLDIHNLAFDAGLAAYVLDATKGAYGYRDIAWEFLGEQYPDPAELLGKGTNKKDISDLTQEQLTEYGTVCADVALRAFDALDSELAFSRLDKLYYDMELPLVDVLLDMESHGIGLDRAALSGFGAKLDKTIAVLTARIYELAGEEFNINSPSQLGHVLFDVDKLGLKGGKKNKQGYSTAADELEKLLGKHPIIRDVLDYRTHVKLKTTYVDGLLAVVCPQTSRVHSTFNQMVTATGRLSSSEPNLQNIPVRLELGRELRKAFVSADGFVFLSGDYSQIELRVLAHLSGDETLIAAFRNGQDIHRMTASQAFGIALDEVTAEQRGNAKAVNFGIVYGISAFSLSQDLGITKAEADRYIAAYFERYPRVKEYLDKTIADAKEKGYTTTMFNRRRKIPELQSHNYNIRAFGERAAMNMPVQGSAADIIKLAMIRVYRRLKERKLKSRLILQVHDELLLEVRKDELAQVREIVKTEMEQAASLKVDMCVELSEGSRL
jgi:DNA polymerase-1